MTTTIEVLVIFVLILLNAIFAMGELALVSVRITRLAVLERKGVSGAGRARALAEDPQRFLPTVQVGITLVGVLAGSFGGARLAARLTPLLARIPALRPIADDLSLALVVLAITYLTLVLGELVPKQLALRAPELIAARLAGPLDLLSRITRPAVWALRSSSELVLRLFGDRGAARQAVTEDELKAMLAEGAQIGVLEQGERDMIERVLRLADKPVRAIMTPRTEIAWLDRTDPVPEIVARIKASEHSRLVVCDGSVDNVVGVVLIKDLLDRMLDGAGFALAPVIRQPMVVPDTVSAPDALERLRADPVGFALVMDEYGSFEGVVTTADVLEAIVGSLTEAANTAQRAGAAAPEGELVMDGMTPVDEIKARLALPDLPAEGSYHTLAGLLLALLQRVPRVGDRIVFGGWLFEVLEMEARRVIRVRVRREKLAEG